MFTRANSTSDASSSNCSRTCRGRNRRAPALDQAFSSFTGVRAGRQAREKCIERRAIALRPGIDQRHQRQIATQRRFDRRGRIFTQRIDKARAKRAASRKQRAAHHRYGETSVCSRNRASAMAKPTPRAPPNMAPPAITNTLNQSTRHPSQRMTPRGSPAGVTT